MPANFFEQVDSLGIVESHIKQVLGLEDDEAKSILRQYTLVRQELVDRLSRARAGTFTQQHLRGVLAQVEGAITAINKHLDGAVTASAYKAALKGVDHLLNEMKVFDSHFTGAVTPINLNAALVAQDTAQFLVTRYKTNLDAYGSDLYRQISNGLFSAVIGEASNDEVVGGISKFFNAEEWKLHRVVRTELHGIYNRAKMKGLSEIEDDVPGLQKTLIHPMDARTGKDSMYAAQKHLVAEINEPFEYVWDGKLRSFMAPPDRPNDRAALVPFNSDWAPARGDATVDL